MTLLTLPPPPLRRRKATGARHRARPKIRVLIIDDNAFVRRGLAAMIDAERDMVCCGSFPATAANVEELLRCRASLVLVDVSIRRGPALELVQELKRRRSAVRIVALAIDEKPGDIARVFDAGAEAWLRKLELAPRVLRAIRRTHWRRHSIRPSRTHSGGTNAGPAPRARLEGTEAEIAELIGLGVPGRAIAVELGLSLAAVEACRRRLRERLGMSASDFVEYCVRWARQRRDHRSVCGV